MHMHMHGPGRDAATSLRVAVGGGRGHEMGESSPKPDGASSPSSPPPGRLTRGALLHVSGLPAAHARDALLAVLAAKGVGGVAVPCRLALVQLGATGTGGKPTGHAYVCIRRVRDAHSWVGTHRLDRSVTGGGAGGGGPGGGGPGGGGPGGGGPGGGPLNITIALSSPANFAAERQCDYVCVQRTADDEMLLSGSHGGAVRNELSLVETMHEGARVTSSMAAAALEELLGFASNDKARFADERFVPDAGLSEGGAGGGAAGV
jgi:hypothetical protein